MSNQSVDGSNGSDVRPQRVAVLGYGEGGRDLALRLRKAGHKVTVGLLPAGMSWVRAVKDGFAPTSSGAAVASADVVLDCCDNFATRHAVNRACVKHRKPLVSGAAIRFDGQLSVFDSRRVGAPCYHCLFPEGEDVEEVRCAVMGVFAPLTGIIGAMQAAEALKLIAEIGEPVTGRLLLLDGLAMEWRSVKFGRDPQCAVCGSAN